MHYPDLSYVSSGTAAMVIGVSKDEAALKSGRSIGLAATIDSMRQETGETEPSNICILIL
jgi:3-hydroxy-3-methylglutaryl CoA synthase